MLVSGADLGLDNAAGVGVPLNLKEVRNRAERDAVARAMSAAAGNVTKAAEYLGVSRPTLYDLIARHNISVADRRDSSPHAEEGAA
jgi:two-component system, NtrC family, response regulator